MKMGKRGKFWYIVHDGCTDVFTNSVDMWEFAKTLVKGA